MTYNTAMAVLISIRPKWCEKIADGEKIVEVRKTAPRNIKTPFKCYIYCAKPKYEHEDCIVIGAGTENCRSFYGGGKIVGEFVCDSCEAYPMGSVSVVRPKPLHGFGMIRQPVSWCYVEEVS